MRIIYTALAATVANGRVCACDGRQHAKRYSAVREKRSQVEQDPPGTAPGRSANQPGAGYGVQHRRGATTAAGRTLARGPMGVCRTPTAAHNSASPFKSSLSSPAYVGEFCYAPAASVPALRQ